MREGRGREMKDKRKELREGEGRYRTEERQRWGQKEKERVSDGGTEGRGCRSERMQAVE